MHRSVFSSVALLALLAAPAANPAQTPVADQIAGAVLPLPKEMRDGAGVMGYKSGGKLEAPKKAEAPVAAEETKKN